MHGTDIQTRSLNRFRWLSLDRLIVFLLPFMFYTSATGELHLAVTDLVFPLLAALALLNPPTERQTRAVRPLCLFALITLIVVVNSALTASLFDPEFNEALAVKNILKLVVVFSYAVVFAMHASELDHDGLYNLLRAWTWAATIVSLCTIATAVGIARIAPLDRWSMRSLGFFQDANLYGGYLVLSLAVVAAAGVMKRSKWTIVHLLIIITAILLTASRGALVSLALISLMALVLISRWKVRLIVAGVGVVTGSLIVFFGPRRLAWLGRAGDRLVTSAQQVGDDSRLKLWAHAISLWKEHPLFGVGIGQFGRFSLDVLGYGDDDVGQIAHNTFFSFLAETGIFGILLCVAGLAFLAFRVYRDQRLDINVRHAFGLGVLAICTEMLTLNLHNVRFVWVFVGLIWGFTRWKEQPGRSADGRSPPREPSDSSAEIYPPGGLSAGDDGAARR
jgi:O-antigen ligase